MYLIKKIKGIFSIKNTRSKKMIFVLLLCLLICAVIVLGGVAVLQKQTINDENKKIHNSVRAGEKIYVNDGHLGQTWLQAIEGLEKNVYNEDNFVSDETFKYYKENGKITSYCGIDVSYFQGEIDWKKLKKQGIEFAMIRVGGRGYSNGEIYEDEMFEKNAEEAHKAGIKVGAYFFSQALNEQEAIEEAKFVLDKISKFHIDYPVAFDWEIIGTESARSDNVSVEDLTMAARAFCDMVSSKGYTPLIYAGDRCLYYKYDLSKLSDIDLWLVDYESYVPSFYYNYTMWQYTCTAVIDGIDGEIDLNICFKNY